MIKANNLSKVYENGTVAINDMTFELPNVGMVAITGTSGCGKSTLLNLLSSNDIPTSGQITYNDKNYAEIGADKLTLDFAYIYQDFKLIDNLTVYQNIMIGHELVAGEANYDFVISIAKELGIFDLLDQKVFALSGGQMQRVSIARAIVRNPKVIFADEPTGNLDSYNSINVYNILRKLATDRLVVVVSHDIEISNWADRVIALEDGEIIADEKGKAVSFVEIKKEDYIVKNNNIEEILQLQKNIKSKKTIKYFSYKNNPVSANKKVGLSGKSSLGLSVSLLNKDIVKKVFLTIVMVILIAFMTLSCAMTFATMEKTLAKAINVTDGKKVFAVTPKIEKKDYIISNNDMAKFDELLQNNSLNYYEIATGEVISNIWDSMYPNSENAVHMAYYANMSCENINNAIFTDDMENVGINIILGKAPKEINEIAISSSYYEYFLYYKNFVVDTPNGTTQINFTEDNFLNNEQIVSIFGVKICGVFDDKNNLDNSLKKQNIANLSDEEIEELNIMLEKEYSTNPLINMIVKSSGAADAWRSFSGVNSNIKITLENCYGIQNSDYYFDFVPLNNEVVRYYNIPNQIANLSLNKNEIVIDSATLDRINEFIMKSQSDSRELKEGDKIPMNIVGMATLGEGMFFPDKTFMTEQIIIAKVVDNIGTSYNTIFMDQNTFNAFNFVPKYSEKRLISDEHISSKSLSNLNKSFEKYVYELFDNNISCGVSYSIPKCPITRTNDFGFVYVCQTYLGIPLMVATSLMTIGIIVIFYFDFVKTKAKDLLILKSLGAKTNDFFRIYGIFCVVLMAIQMLFGLLLGDLLIYLFNIFATKMNGYNVDFSVFYLDGLSWVFTIFAVIAINVVSLAISLLGINNKNLRKSFQKLKK